MRWLPADVAGDLRPRLPVCAAGAVCYRFAAADDGDTHAIQVEAVRDDGARVLFATQGKRPSVTGSRFAAGARVFVARAGGPDVHVCESVVDSLSVATAAWGAPVGAAVIAAAGTSGLSAAAVSRWPGTVTVWAQGDGPGLSGALRLCLALEGDGRTVRSDVRWPGREGYPGRFWLMVEAMSTIYRRIIELTRLKLSSIYHPTYIFRPAPQLLPLGRAENSQASGL